MFFSSPLFVAVFNVVPLHIAVGVTQNDIEEAKLFDQLPVTYSPKWLRENPEASAAAAATAAAPAPAPSSTPSPS